MAKLQIKMKDTIQIIKGLFNDPVPYVNTTVLFGLTAMQWDLLIKLLVAIPSVVWTYYKIINEIKKYKSNSEQ
jgi:hypothetical protein